MGSSADRSAISSLRAVAHPVRLRILSMLTAEAMSAAEVARALDLTHANASYHLRVLHDVGQLVVEGEEKVRGGTARRYRYLPGTSSEQPAEPTSTDDELAWEQATHTEVSRRLPHRRRELPGSASDLEAWVAPDVWREAVDLLTRASRLLHSEARPAGTEGTIHVSATQHAFVMDDDS